MEEIVAATPELRLYYIDITNIKQDPDLPVARQYNVEGPPDFLMYNPDGERVMKGMKVFKTVKERWGR